MTETAPADIARWIIIRDLTLDCRIGVYDIERDADQPVVFNIELGVRDNGPIEDAIANVIDYDHIVAGVKAIIAAGHINLIETLADRIGDFCLTDRRVVRVRVRAEKPAAVAEAAGVGVEIVRNAPLT